MKKPGLVIALLVLCISGFSQSTTTVSREQTPFSGGVSAPCSTEVIFVSGILESIIIQTFNGQLGVVEFHTKEGRTSTGVGMTTGIPYRVRINQFSKFMFDRNTLSNTSLKQSMTLQGSGPDNNLTINFFIRMVFDGTVFHTVFEKASVDCK